MFSGGIHIPESIESIFRIDSYVSVNGFFMNTKIYKRITKQQKKFKSNYKTKLSNIILLQESCHNWIWKVKRSVKVI